MTDVIAGGHRPGLSDTRARPSVLSIVNGDTVPIIAGTPIYSTSGRGCRACALHHGKSGVIGIVVYGAAQTLPMQVMTAGVLELERAQWNAVLNDNTEGLIPDAIYYLVDSALGKLTTTPPSLPGRSVVVLGQALHATSLIVRLDLPILL